MVKRLNSMGEALALRPACEADAAFWHDLRQDAVARAHMPLLEVSPAELAKRIAQSDGVLMATALVEAVWIAHWHGQPAAVLTVHDRSPMMATARLGCLVAPALRRRGVAIGALSSLIEQLFAAGYRRLHALVSVDNLASCALFECLGFVREGCLRQHYRIEGREIDQVIYGLMRTEWRDRRGKEG